MRDACIVQRGACGTFSGSGSAVLPCSAAMVSISLAMRWLSASRSAFWREVRLSFFSKSSAHWQHGVGFGGQFLQRCFCSSRLSCGFSLH
jgi:hypothetical protein